jgi:hypothetical protein
MEKFLEYLQEAEKIIRTTDHLTYITFPLVKEKKLLLKIIAEIKRAVAYCITSILQYEYTFKRIKLADNPKTNMKIFENKCSGRYNITKNQLSLISELFDIAKQHEKSPMEFVRKEKVVIMTENSSVRIITLEKTKEFLELSKKLLKNSKDNILR